jgi:hypothetical protein
MQTLLHLDSSSLIALVAAMLRSLSSRAAASSLSAAQSCGASPLRPPL